MTNNWKYIYDKKTIYSLTGIVAKEKVKNFSANNGVDSKSLQAKFDATYILNDKISLIPGVLINIRNMMKRIFFGIKEEATMSTSLR